MKEELVVLPEDVVILRGHLGDKKNEPLPLSVIPDTEAKAIREGTEFVMEQQAVGNPHAGAFHSYTVFEGKRFIEVVSYRIVLKK